MDAGSLSISPATGEQCCFKPYHYICYLLQTLSPFHGLMWNYHTPKQPTSNSKAFKLPIWVMSTNENRRFLVMGRVSPGGCWSQPVEDILSGTLSALLKLSPCLFTAAWQQRDITQEARVNLHFCQMSGELPGAEKPKFLPEGCTVPCLVLAQWRKLNPRHTTWWVLACEVQWRWASSPQTRLSLESGFDWQSRA